MGTGVETKSEHVLIVGGSSGIGLALARFLLEEGAEVTIAGRSEARLEEARASLSPAGDRLTTVVADITREEHVARLFGRIGPLDHIVTTAADIEGAYQLLPSLDIAAAQRVVDSKFIGPLLLAKHGAPVLSPRGSITFTSGIAAYRPAARGSVVAAINGALESLAYARGRTRPDPGQRGLAGLGRFADLEARRGRRHGRNAGRHGEAGATTWSGSWWAGSSVPTFRRPMRARRRGAAPTRKTSCPSSPSSTRACWSAQATGAASPRRRGWLPPMRCRTGRPWRQHGAPCSARSRRGCPRRRGSKRAGSTQTPGSSTSGTRRTGRTITRRRSTAS